MTESRPRVRAVAGLHWRGLPDSFPVTSARRGLDSGCRNAVGSLAVPSLRRPSVPARAAAAVGLSLALWGGVLARPCVAQSQQAALPVAGALTAPPRPAIPADPSRQWLVPDTSGRPQPKLLTDFVTGVRLLNEAKFEEALPLLSAPGLAATPLASYAAYLTALAQLNLGRPSEARTTFARLREARLTGFLAEAAMAREAEAAVAQDDQASAAKLYGELSTRKTASPDAVLLALGRALLAAGDRLHAAEAFGKLYYEFPSSDLAAVASTELDGLRDLVQARDPAVRLKLELGRAERLFSLRRYAAAKSAFEALQPVATGDEAELIGLRRAECDHYLHHYREARGELDSYVERASRKAEARFFQLTAVRELGDLEEYVRLCRDFVAAFPDSSWAEEALNNLATHYIVADDDERADAVFRELYARYPQGAHAERAAWKAGWWAFKHGGYNDAVAFFESAASTFPRSDYRPAYLYWSARARELSGDHQGAVTIYRLVVSDYLYLVLRPPGVATPPEHRRSRRGHGRGHASAPCGRPRGHAPAPDRGPHPPLAVAGPLRSGPRRVAVRPARVG